MYRQEEQNGRHEEFLQSYVKEPLRIDAKITHRQLPEGWWRILVSEFRVEWKFHKENMNILPVIDCEKKKEKYLLLKI